MAQRKLTWAELRVGLFVLAALVILAVGLFYVTGTRGPWVPKYRLTTYLPEVQSLQNGAPVTLDGLAVGNVESISLTPHPQDKLHNITIVLRIDKKYQDQIRTDSTASLVTEGLLGNRYVDITRGVTGGVIPKNGIVPGAEVPEIKDVVERGADVAQNLQVLSTQLNEIVQKVNRGEGTIGKFMNDPSFYNHLNGSAAKIEAMITSIQGGNGSVGKLVASDELYNRVSSVVGKVDDVMGAVRDQKGTMGKLIYDPTIAENVKGITEKGNAVFTDIRAGKGTLGKLATDDTAYNNLRDASANVRDATAKLNSNQGTLGKMFSDPALYDNLTGLSGDMRLLIKDFRQNPKKFLRIKLGVF
ncbi:MAG TPA: MlaD family protein [Candidatus Limnocylindrales bacterium]|nr:MlaD family protein [Candidatus Limnocylindrales bacterium]